ncbi:glutamate--cysteine ligase [Crystallibacter crystallopoietes]|uniref:glutamate--cysteine ligase n=1 Tax=Crystallibacter crystallopoietes TaxID=37928 RepID=UPI0005C1F9B2|nr:glutamate--cysteine ligase [Arthrobacter crystallopoietes]
MRTFGVEEELLLVDADSGSIKACVDEVLGGLAGQRDPAGIRLVSELQREQLEVITPVHSDLGELAEDIVAGRALADALAVGAGARAAALATPVLPFVPHLSAVPRVGAMEERFGLTAREQLTCACHVHVGVESGDEGVAVLDRIRSWLPVLSALSANSPFWQGRDTGYASYRIQSLGRWPMAGPAGIYGSLGAYRRRLQALLDTEVPLDEAMLYLDARLSRSYPTVEIRVADVCLYPDDAVLIAALSRALVETAARQWRAAVPPADVPTAVLRLANWRASRSGIGGDLLHPLSGVPRPAGEVLDALMAHLAPALADNGDGPQVEALLKQVMHRGTGAEFQRRTLEQTGTLAGVVKGALAATHRQA